MNWRSILQKRNRNYKNPLTGSVHASRGLPKSIKPLRGDPDRLDAVHTHKSRSPLCVPAWPAASAGHATMIRSWPPSLSSGPELLHPAQGLLGTS